MSSHIWQVFTYELRRNIRRRGFLFTTFGVPLIGFVLVFGIRFIGNINAQNAATNPPAPSEQTEEQKPAGYVDLTGEFTDAGDLSDRLIYYPDEAAAQAAMDAGDVDSYYVIQADYLETGDVTHVIPRFSINQVDSGPIRQLVLKHLAADVNPDLFSRLVNPVTT